ncbi:hypothetical protein H4Q26_002754 [Puccinia striiformis f. sp. tritici PST-130]|nr:hypothetical protein H4Q26_002754 [Puccinia striiformis f. sp. tritici PST-130]
MRRSSAWLSSLIVSTLTLTSSISAQDSSNNSTATPSNLANLPGFDSTITALRLLLRTQRTIPLQQQETILALTQTQVPTYESQPQSLNPVKIS